MSTNNTSVKAYSKRTGALWRTDDATTVTAVTIATKPNHVYLINVVANTFNAASGGTGGAFVRTAAFLAAANGQVTIVGAAADILTVGSGLLTIVGSGTQILVRITGPALILMSWQIAVDVMEGGTSAENVGWTNG